MDSRTLGALLRQAARDHGALEAVVDADERLSFAGLDKAADLWVMRLLRAGVGHGDHVGIWLPTSPEWIVLFCACARLGAVAVPINTRYQAREVEHFLRKADIGVLITQRSPFSIDVPALLQTIVPHLASGLPNAAMPALRRVIFMDDDAPAGAVPARDFDTGDQWTEAEIAAIERKVAESDVLLICFTSGSTGDPKGVVHTHRALRHCERLAQAMRCDPGDRILMQWPLNHVAGLFVSLAPAIIRGCTLVLLPHWSGEAALDLIESERVSTMGGISTHYVDLIEAMEAHPRDTSSLKVAYVSGATISAELFSNILTKLRLPRLLSTYGMTENVAGTTFNNWDDPPDVCRQNKAPVISEGPVKLVDPVTLLDVPVGRQGEIWCHGPSVMVGYYKDVAATRPAVTDDGWLRTGDLGVFDDEGRLAITGRLKDLVKVGGFNVAPAEVEAVVASHPDIRFAVIVGVPDHRLGEVCFAFVQAASDARVTEADVISFCRDKIAAYKVPKYVRFVDAFPRLSTGKIQRSALVEEAAVHVGGRK